MAKPDGFPSRALTMIVPYGPAGGSGQIAAIKAEIVAGDAADLNVVDMKGKRSIIKSTRVNETLN